MANKIYYTVSEDYTGKIVVQSFGGKSKGQEAEFARTINRKVFAVHTSYESAKAQANREEHTKRLQAQ